MNPDFDLQEELKKLPDRPGVYIMHDRSDAILYVGKASLTEENLKNVEEALTARELIKIGVQKNCEDEPAEIAAAMAEHTNSVVVQVIGKKIVLYREGSGDKKRIELPVSRGRG